MTTEPALVTTQVDPVYQEMSVAEKLNLFENGQCPDPSVSPCSFGHPMVPLQALSASPHAPCWQSLILDGSTAHSFALIAWQCTWVPHSVRLSSGCRAPACSVFISNRMSVLSLSLQKRVCI